MSIKLTTMQAAYLTRAMTTGGGLIELGELAKGLGKQKAHVVRKLEANFDKERLSKMETHLTVMGGNHKNVAQTVKTYMLDYKTAGALAMSYDLQLGVEVLTLLEEAVQTIGAMTGPCKQEIHKQHLRRHYCSLSVCVTVWNIRPVRQKMKPVA